MKTCMTMFSAAVLTMALAACSHVTADTRDNDAKALRDNEAQWNQDFVAKDVDKLVAHYSDDATLMSPGMPASTGKDAIRKVLQGMITDSALSLKFHASRVEIAKSGDLGFTQGAYTMTMTDPVSKKPMNDHGSYVTTYLKQPDGNWKAVSDIATSEVPQPGTPAAQ